MSAEQITSEDGVTAVSPLPQHAELSESDLSLVDEDYAQRIRDILAAKYGVIAVNEPILHTAIANAAALDFVSGQIKRLMAKQRDGILEDYQTIRDDVTNTLALFEHKLVTIIQTATAETCMKHVEEFRIISEKQTAQIEYLLTHGLKSTAAEKTTPSTNDRSLASKDANASTFWSQFSPWQTLGFGALLGGVVSLIVVAFIL
ncbi:hypothetical protein [Vibrio parahaemolyticus]|uniref:hypothetical protein n=1 Tax=Vibrio parahaemolyticus TaxID=670 RepID=UPI000D53069E|nr:hypothetical protein [Vibrio parahaemolyticus]AWG82250.1 hypothetical protein C9I78_26080 [Vibrio parahaemolyticus]AWJ81888.1 hypothetical protein C7Y67_26175 [Vibrio parahaemolyticus]